MVLSRKLLQFVGIGVFGLWIPAALALAPSSSPSRVVLGESVRAVSAGPADAGAPRLVRSALTPGELATPMEFEVVLKLRHADELAERVAQGQIISADEMAEKYLPTAADYQAVKAWLAAQGLALTAEHGHHLAVFAHGSASQVRDGLQVAVGRVAFRGAEYTSATTAPQVPAELAPLLVGINGLQPHLQVYPLPHPNSLTSNASPYTPTQLAKAYNANGLTANGQTLTGSGQIIAIVGGAYPNSNDLALFWSRVGVTPTNTTYATVPIAGGPSSASIAADQQEATLDAEWASTLAPGATMRIYGAPASFDPAYAQIIADLPANPTMRQVSISYGSREVDTPTSQLQTEQQYFLTMAALGITVFASSGDGGSRPDAAGTNYSTANPLSVGEPASNPYVTAVGGTTLVLNATTGAVATETGWAGSGGGTSIFYSRPGWQSGPGVPAGTKRLVPDVALAGDPADGAYQVINGSSSLQGGGTSWSSPSWAAFCALLNQACTGAGQPPVGLLGPKIYPLLGTGSAAFRDITSGSNGDYSAGAGYDQVTGLGVPNLAVLLPTLLGTPTFTTAPADKEVVAGANATFSVVATGNPAPTSYRWQRLAFGFNTWTLLSDTGAYSGTATANLVISGATLGMSGDQFECIVSNGTYTTYSLPATLLVKNLLVVSTFAGQAGSSGVADGAGSSARFSGFLSGIAVDGAGNVYVSDYGYSDIRKITPDGTVSTLAGSPGVTGTADGAATAARFSGPWGLAVDSSGDLFVADYNNHTIREITPAGAVSTVAGAAGVAGSADGAGTAARFNHPAGLAIDTANNLYVADSGNDTIRKVTPQGAVTTLAGAAGVAGASDGTGSAAQFASPQGVAVDGAGNVYVADTSVQTIRKVTAAGVVTTLAGFAGTTGATDGAGFLARFYFPSALAVDPAGNLFVSDQYNDTIRMVTPLGLTTTVAGVAGTQGASDGTGSNALFYKPWAIALDHSGNFYIADSYNDTIRKATLASATTGSGSAPAVSIQPTAQTVAAGATVVFSATASGSPAPTYQWELNGQVISGATTSRLLLTAASANAGTYTCVISNANGVVTTTPQQLTVVTTANPGHLVNLSILSNITGALTMGFVNGGAGTSGLEPLLIRAVGPSLGAPPFNYPGILPDPTLQLVQQSGSITLATNAGWGTPANNAAAVMAADNATGAFALTNTASLDSALVENLPAVGGGYSVVVAGKTGDSGNAITEVYDATSNYTATSTRLINLSCITTIPAGGALGVGFVLGGATNKTLLIRVSGPTLAAFGTPGTMLDPQMVVTPQSNGAITIASNSGWGGDAVISAVAASIGAFAFTSTTSHDSAVVLSLPPGVPYTVEVNSASSGGGAVLVEIYEVP